MARWAAVILGMVMALCSMNSAWADGSLYPMDTKEDWDNLWEVDAESAWGDNPNRQQIDLNYHRFIMMPRETFVAGNVARALGWTRDSSVLVVKCGFGWILEGLAIHGVTNTLCAETSSYIHSSKTVNEDVDLRAKVEGVGLATNSGDGLAVFNAFRGDGGVRSKRAASILNEALDTQASRQTVRQAMGAPGFDVITHDGYLNSHTDTEAIALSENLHRIPGAGRIIHHVYSNWLNPHTLDEWKAMLPNDVFILNQTWEVRE